MTSRVLNRRQARWSTFLSEFNFVLAYAPGIKNPADAPSRCADFAPREGDETLQVNRKVLLMPQHTQELFDAPSAAIRVAALTSLAVDNSDFLERYKAALREDQEWRTAITRSDKNFAVDGSLVYHDGLLYVPRSLRADIVSSRHDAPTGGHAGRVRTLAKLRADFSWPGMATYIRSYVRTCDVCGRIKTPRHK
ncbi:uncharacterized protein TRAVEDRAFT_86289, partial [Trametes versicolor FP-101664 SS1]|uniref:uncharacterized protein n=1 Tax=Trametes versicolor (strain FP-101664) TaxID=717944 RepID=UPI0004623B7D